MTARILVVDDAPDMLDLFRIVLEREFSDAPAAPNAPPGPEPMYELALADRAQPALDLVRQAMADRRPFGAAFIDYRLGDGPDGLWLAGEIRTLDPDLQIVIVSGSGSFDPDEIRQRIPPADKILYLRKPVHPREILQFAASLTAKWRAENLLRESRIALERQLGNGQARLAEATLQSHRETQERRRAENDLTQSEERYRTLVEESFDAVFVHDGQFIQFVNKRATHLLGYSEKEIVGQDFRRFCHPDSIQLMWERAQARLRGENVPSRYEIRLVRKDGSILDAEINARPVVLGGKKAIQTWTRDISGEKRAAKELERSLSLLKATLESTADGILVVSREGRIEGYNRKFTRMWGVPEAVMAQGDAVGLLDYVLPRLADPEAFRDEVDRITRQPDQETHGEIRFKDGRVFDRYSIPQRIQDQVVGRVWSFREVTGARRTEKALKESEEQYRVIVDSSLSGIYIIQDGRFRYVNPRFVEIMGYDRADEVVGRSFWELVYPDDREWVKDRGLRREHGEPVSPRYTFRALRKDGTTVWLEMGATSALFRSRLANIGNVIDLTDQVLAEEALKATENRFQTMVHQSPFSTIIFRPDGRPVMVNRAFRELWGTSEEETRRLLDQYNILLDRRLFTSGLMLYIRRAFSGQPTATPAVRFGPPGSPVMARGLKKDIWLRAFVYPVKNEAGRLTEVVMMQEDVTERHLAEQELAKSLSLLRATLEASADGIMVVDPAGHVVDYNQRILDIWQVSEGELLGTPVEQRWNRARSLVRDPDDYLAQVERLYRQPEEESFDVIEFLDGRVFERYSRPQRIGGRSVGRVWSYRDVSARVRAEREMKNLERQLLHSQKMEAVGTLAGGVAHDFNNILTGILGNLGLAMDRLPPDSDLRRYLETAGVAAERARDLTRHLLTFSRVTEPTKKPMSLAGPIQETVRLLAQTLDRRIQIQAKVAKDLARIEADEGQMSQVLMNLCVNAGDAVEKRLAESPRPSGPASEHPAIVVRAANVDLPDIPDPIQNQRRPGRYVRLDVEDQGCGMDETTRSRIFEPFFTTKPIDKGTGLGLSTVYGIVRQHLGWIEVESEPDRGTRFSVYLPVTLNAPAETGDQGERFGALPGGTETILLVDDEDMIRDVGQELLESLGYQVLVAGDGQEALDRFRTDGGRLDLIILDMIMPRLSGLEVLKKVKSTRSRVKIILSSGNLLDSMAGTIPKEAAPEAFVAKPYRIQDLARIVRRVLDGQGEEERVSVKGESR